MSSDLELHHESQLQGPNGNSTYRYERMSWMFAGERRYVVEHPTAFSLFASKEMFARACTRCVVRPRSALRTNAVSSRVQRRSYGTAPGSGSTASSTQANGLSAGSLAPLVSELDRMAPSFDICGEDVCIIRSPADFYETLKVRYITWHSHEAVHL